jgi:hypothetical protein
MNKFFIVCLFLLSLPSMKLLADKKSIDKIQFANPAIKYRPLKMLHENLDTAVVARLKQLGYGGIVTNVSYNNYLKSPDNWKRFQDVISYAINTLGVRIWLYDELGYPSGAAGGLVLKEHPQLEAQGLAVIKKEIDASEQVFIPHPVGHKDVIFVHSYKMNGDKPDFTDQGEDLLNYVDESGNLKWTAPHDGLKRTVYYFVRKPYYEGTHATANWTAKRRYINVMEKTATEYFVDITHKQYYQYVGKYFGKGIEAFFTDEPSYLGTYFTGHNPPGNPPVEDELFPNFLLLLTLNWGNYFPDEFKKRCGYDLLLHLPYLITDDSKQAQKVRMDYYRTLAELFAENYFGTINAFCNRTGVASSGHLLLEEHLFFHPVFEGDLMMMYKNMGYPGIDLLTAHPATAKDWGVTMAKMARSVADFYGKKHVMSEISDAFDTEKADLYGRMAAVGVQFAYGIDYFNSYYNTNNMNDTENRLFTDYIGRVGYMTGQGKRTPKIAVFYPIETIWAHTFPSMSLEPSDFNHKAVEISDNFKNLAMTLVENQIDFDYWGTAQILEAKITDGSFMSPAGNGFSVLIIPAHAILGEKVLSKIKQFEKAGGTIISVSNINDAPDLVRKHIALPLQIEGHYPEIVSSHRHADKFDLFLFVNTGDTPRSFECVSQAKGDICRIWNPLTGDVESLKVERTKDSAKFTISLEKWQTVIVTLE